MFILFVSILVEIEFVVLEIGKIVVFPNEIVLVVEPVTFIDEGDFIVLVKMVDPNLVAVEVKIEVNVVSDGKFEILLCVLALLLVV